MTFRLGSVVAQNFSDRFTQCARDLQIFIGAVVGLRRGLKLVC